MFVAADKFGGDVENFQVTGTGDIQTTLNEIQSKLQGDPSIDAVLTLNPDIAIAARDAVAGSGSEAQLATFDLSGDVVTAIKDGEILFAVDQQQYLQGYLPVVFLTLYNTNANASLPETARSLRLRSTRPNSQSSTRFSPTTQSSVQLKMQTPEAPFSRASGIVQSRTSTWRSSPS